ncbi:MAG: DUF1592 domain-containing protein [Myxococcales bacterium]|nr:DUF1592 domain-containing protein [Myxococcales bacterium]
MRIDGWVWIGAMAIGILGGCSGRVAGAPVVPPEVGNTDLGPRRMALLTASQYLNTLLDVLPSTLSLPAESALPPDLKVDGFGSVGASTAALAPTGIEKYEMVAMDVASRLITVCPYHADRNQPVCEGWRQRRMAFFGCSDGELTDACVAEWVIRFGRRTWRRPLTDAEVSQMSALWKSLAIKFGDPWRGLEFVLSAFLQSPHLLYRVEYGEPDSEGTQWRYTGYEMASRLAFTLWDRGPDDALLAAAESGELLSADGVRLQVDRMLDDPRARYGLSGFLNEYLALDRVTDAPKDTLTYPELTNTLRVSMQTELRMLFEDTVFENDGSFLDLFVTHKTFLNPELAGFYGVPAPQEGWAEGEFPVAAKRGGWLSRAATLFANAHAVRTSPTLRGLFVRQNMLCQSVGSPPPNVVNALEIEPEGGPRTLRSQLEDLHAKDPVCAGCHQRMDPVGFAFENFNAIGKYRDLDNGLPVDSSTELDGIAVNGATELGAALSKHPDTVPCLVKRLYRYATGRIEESREGTAIKDLSAAFEADGYRFKSLVSDLLVSDAFRKVRAPLKDKP